MECRLCLTSKPSEEFVSIHDDLDSLVLCIRNCCQLHVKKNDGLPDTICSSCESNLKSFTAFKSICAYNDRIRRPECSDIKTEEVILDDLTWTTAVDTNSSKVDEKNSLLYHNLKIENLPIEFVVNRKRPTQLKFTCDYCGEVFHTKSNLRMHILMHYKQNPYTCDICLMHFAYMQFLETHMRIIHSTRKIHKCGKCLTTLPTNAELTRHTRGHVEVRKVFKLHKCKVCHKSFRQNVRYVEHMNVHKYQTTGEKPFKCKRCPKTFTRKAHFVMHTKMHAVQQVYVCDVCLKAFTKKFSLKKHMNSHAVFKKHKCGDCSETFSSKSKLAKHVNFHDELKPHKCGFCFKSFDKKSSLVLHRNVHKTKFADGNSLRCKLCLESFTSQFRLVQHLKKHPVLHTCDLCTKSFKRKILLEQHMSIHTGLKQHKCEFCSKLYTSKSILVRHILKSHKSPKKN